MNSIFGANGTAWGGSGESIMVIMEEAMGGWW